MSSLIVKPHRPWRTRLIIAVVAVGVLLGGWGLFEYGRARAGYDSLAAEHAQARLQQAGQQCSAALEKLQEQNAILQRGMQIDHKAYQDLESTVTNLQSQVADLKGQLAFYRGIVSPKDAQQGLRIEAFGVTPNGTKNGFRYKLVLTQVLKGDRLARGKILLNVEGLQAGQSKVLSLDSLASDGNKVLSFSFKYFQNFEGDITLPAGFAPTRVVVKVEPYGNTEKVEKTFDWPPEEG